MKLHSSKKALSAAAARPRAKVTKFGFRPARTAEPENPFEDTGTFGKF